MKTVTVFGSAEIKEGEASYQQAKELGGLLAQNGFTLCNGGYSGLMEATSRGAREYGGKTKAVVTREFSPQANPWMQEVTITETWRERIFKLIDSGDAYVVLDGGTGTLTELFIVWEMANKKGIRKPIIVLGSFVRRLVEQLKKEKLVRFANVLKLANKPSEVLDFLHEAF
jgi:uncharacterized protein (TIGR00730 family)